MIVRELTIANWGRFIEPVTVTFDEGFNLISGPNEAGKTTLLTALTMAFFTKHSVTGEVIEKIKPIGKGGHPRVRVVFSEGGQEYILEKHFGAKKCQLTVKGTKVPFEKSAAEEELARILNGIKGESSRKMLEKGLAQALWFLQDQETDPHHTKVNGQWTQNVAEGLSQRRGEAPKTPEERRIRSILKENVETYLTSTGKDCSTSPLKQAENEYEVCLSQINSTRLEKEGLDSTIAQLRSMVDKQIGEESNGRDLLAQIEKANALISQGQIVKSELDAMEANYNKDETALTIKVAARTSVSRRRLDIAAKNEEIIRIEEQIATSDASAQEFRKAAEIFHALSVKKKGELEDCDARNLLLDKASLLHRHIAWGAQLATAVDNRRRDENELSALIKALSDTQAPSVEEARAIREKQNRLSGLREKIKGGSISVKFSTPSISITTDPHVPMASDGNFTISQRTVFKLGELGSMEISGIGVAKADIEESSRLEEEIESILVEFKVADPIALEAVAISKEGMVGRMTRLKEQLSENPPVAQDDLDRSQKTIADLQMALQNATDLCSMTDAQLEQLQSQLDEQRGVVCNEMTNAQNGEEAQNQLLAAHIAKCESLPGLVIGLRSAIDQLSRENEEALRGYGTFVDLETAIEMGVEALKILEQTRDTKRELHRNLVDEPSRKKKEAELLKIGCEARLLQLAKDTSSLRGRIDTLTDVNLDDRMAELMENEARLKKKVEMFKGKREALRLLDNLIAQLEQIRNAGMAEPIKKKVDVWLAFLTEGAHDQVQVDDERLFPVLVSSDEGDLPMRCLSHGTSEQIGVLTRLAIGVLSAQGERNLVVIDDRMVNSDPARLEKFVTILNEVSGSCQLIMTTCNPSPYGGAKGKRIPME